MERNLKNNTHTCISTYDVLDYSTVFPYATTYNTMLQQEITYSILRPEDTGTLVMDITNQLISEPFYIMCFPLFDCTISLGSKKWVIKRDIAFTIFNTVIQYLNTFIIF